MRFLRVLLVLFYVVFTAAAQRSPWKTLTGVQPVVIGNGGQPAVYPEETFSAYNSALQMSEGGIILLCNLQLTKDNQGICRTTIDLSSSTDVSQVYPGANKTYTVNGIPTSAYFSIDFDVAQIANLTATQTVSTRPPPPTSDGVYSPDDLAQLLASYTKSTRLPAFIWLNVEYPTFYEEHKLNVTSYVVSAIKRISPSYISSPEVGFLRTIRSRAGKSNTKTILKIPVNTDSTEPTTKVTYGAMLSNLTNIRSFASGVMISKNIIWPVDNNTLYIHSPTAVVRDAHGAQLEVYAYGFQNDLYPSSFNYSFDPIKELMYFINGPDFSVDGVITDFPTTASIALECYANQGANGSVKTGKQLVITHGGGDSGNYPGGTRLAYTSAISKGADYIDCPVQMTRDGVAVCTEFIDLLVSTDAASSPFLSKSRKIASIQGPSGIFTFDLTLKEISTLKAKIYSPYQEESSTYRDRANDGTQSILALSDVLTIAKDNKVGIYLVLEKAYLLNGTQGIDTVTAVVKALTDAGLNNNPNVIIESEDSIVLEQLRKLVSAQLMYTITTKDVTVTDAVLTEIKQFANGIAVPRPLVSPSSDSFLTVKGDLVDRVHKQNMTVNVVYFRNEFVALPFDFLADPTIELNQYVQLYGIDGIVTDFPQTATSYLSNRCLRQKKGYQIITMEPGKLVAPAPSPGPPPVLSIAEPPLPPGAAAAAPAPSASSRNSGFTVCPKLWLLLICLALHLHRLF